VVRRAAQSLWHNALIDAFDAEFYEQLFQKLVPDYALAYLCPEVIDEA
jgi:hypothetical protein